MKKHPLQNRTNVQIKGGGGSKAFWTMFKKTALFWKGGIPKCKTRFNSKGMILNGFLKKSFFKIGMLHSRPPRDPPPFRAKTILNFHFDYLTPSLSSIQFASPFLSLKILFFLPSPQPQAWPPLQRTKIWWADLAWLTSTKSFSAVVVCVCSKYVNSFIPYLNKPINLLHHKCNSRNV